MKTQSLSLWSRFCFSLSKWYFLVSNHSEWSFLTKCSSKHRGFEFQSVLSNWEKVLWNHLLWESHRDSLREVQKLRKDGFKTYALLSFKWCCFYHRDRFLKDELKSSLLLMLGIQISLSSLWFLQQQFLSSCNQSILHIAQSFHFPISQLSHIDKQFDRSSLLCNLRSHRHTHYWIPPNKIL